MSKIDEVRARLKGSLDTTDMYDAVTNVVALWPELDDREPLVEDDSAHAWDEGYCEAMDEVLDVIAEALGIMPEDV